GHVNIVSHFLSLLPRTCRQCSLSRTRLVAAGVLQHPDFPYDLGDRNRAARDHYSEPRLAAALRPAPRHRSLDLSDLAVCLGYRRRDLPDALLPVSRIDGKPVGGARKFTSLTHHSAVEPA